MKRLRFKYSEVKIRSFGCAEYGENFGRPHFHLLLFNFDFPDKYFFKYSSNDFSPEKWPVFRSDILEELWPFGFSEIGSVTFESAAYVARYVTKKVNGEKRESHYGDRLPERSVCVSNRKGIGLPWLERFHSECLANDGVFHDGIPLRLPRYYSKKLEEMFPDKFAVLKQKRLDKIKEIDLDSTRKRMSVREMVHELKFKKLKRKYENGT